MNNAALLRTLVIYALVVPLALFIGYMLTITNEWDYSTFALMGAFLLALVFPLLLRWHYPLLLLSWNMAMMVFFIQGDPNICLLMVALSLAMSILGRTMNRNQRFINVPQIIWPLLGLVFVVLITAKLTGGFGLHTFGSEVYGGKKYIFLLVAILGYFALTAQKIPPNRARLYVILFFIGGVTNFIGDLYSFIPSSLNVLFWFFPPTSYDPTGGGFDSGMMRLRGTGFAAFAILCCLMAGYGIRGIFLSGKPWRFVLFMLFFGMSFLGGFRSTILSICLLFLFQFFLEGLYRTKLLPLFAMIGLLGIALVVPLAGKLPFTFQRALAFLPLQLNPAARLAAEDSSQWRIDMWEALLPQVPKHLLLGKGYAITTEDYEMMGQSSDFRAVDPSQQGLALSSDYHSGPLSVILPFGIWGVIAVLWFFIIALRVLYFNFRYGESAVKTVNAFLLAMFLMKLIMFIFVVGALNSDLLTFVGLLGLSVAVNGGMRRRAPQPVPVKAPVGSKSSESFPFRPRPVLPRWRHPRALE